MPETRVRTDVGDRRAARRTAGDRSPAPFLAALFEGEPRGSLVELRYRSGTGMRRAFYGADRLDAVAAEIRWRTPRTDVYVGVLPRRRRGGGRDDLVLAGRVVWVDCDTPHAVAALRGFGPPPSIVVGSGTGENRHAYWLLSHRESLDTIERANRQLAGLLGADIASSDAARILRPPPGWNHKHHPPAGVELAHLDPTAMHRMIDLVGDLPDPLQQPSRTDPREVWTAHGAADPLLAIAPRAYVERLADLTVPRHGKVRCPFHDLSVTRGPGSQKLNSAILCGRDVKGTPRPSDPLRLIPPPVYFERLTGLRVGRSGKLRCLFHDDRSPSLHVYREPGRGWYCFGCGRGGSIYDLAALLWLTGQSSAMALRGDDFRLVRARLLEIFAADVARR
jgi:hypothetical protein